MKALIIIGSFLIIIFGIAMFALLRIGHKGKQKRPRWCTLPKENDCFLFESGELNKYEDCKMCCWRDSK